MCDHTYIHAGAPIATRVFFFRDVTFSEYFLYRFHFLFVWRVCMYVCMVITSSRVWTNRVRLPILLVVSWTGKMNIPLSPCVPENLVCLARRVQPSRRLLISVLRPNLVVRRTFFPPGWCFFYLVSTGWIFYISLLCENSINQSNTGWIFYIISWWCKKSSPCSQGRKNTIRKERTYDVLSIQRESEKKLGKSDNSK